MFKKIILSTSLAIASFSALAATGGSDGTIDFIGGFTTTPCKVDINGGSNSPTIDLGWWSTANFTATDLDTDFIPVTISLTDCPAEITNQSNTANITFKGDTVNGKSNYFKVSNTDLEDTVGVGLYKSQNSSSIITPNTRDLSIQLTGNSGQEVIFAAYRTFAETKGGDANSSVTFDISYN